MRAAPCLAMLALPLAACVSTNAALLDPSVKYQKICSDGVQLFTTAQHVPSDYREIALLHSKGESGWTTERGMMNSQRQKASALGANGIILNNIREPNAGTKIIGAILGTGSERQGAAVAIYIPADSERVRQACGLAPKESQVASSRALIRVGGSTQAEPAATPTMVAPPEVRAPDPVTAEAVSISNAADAADTQAPTGYVGYPASDPPALPPGAAVAAPAQPFTPVAEGSRNAGRFNGELRRSFSLRRSLDDVTRLRIVTEYQEVRRGVLKLMIGSGYDGGAVEYNLRRLWLAYSEATEYERNSVIELWYGDRKLGEYTSEGLLVGPEFSAPR